MDEGALWDTGKLTGTLSQGRPDVKRIITEGLIHAEFRPEQHGTPEAGRHPGGVDFRFSI
jgi:hypothetical protein